MKPPVRLFTPFIHQLINNRVRFAAKRTNSADAQALNMSFYAMIFSLIHRERIKQIEVHFAEEVSSES